MKLIDFIVCDDIRREQGGKASVMGIYNDLIRFEHPGEITWPLPMRLGIFVRVSLGAADNKPTGFRISLVHDKQTLGKFEGEIKIREVATVLSLPLVTPHIPIPGPGLLHFHLALLRDGQEIFTAESPVPIRVEGLDTT